MQSNQCHKIDCNVDLLGPLLDQVLTTLVQTDLIGELGARRHDLASAIRNRHSEAVRTYVREAPLDLIPDETDCLYARGLVLWRLERLYEAERHYINTGQMVTESDFASFEPWIDIQVAWLRLLQGDQYRAQQYIEASMDNADAGTWANFSVSQGVLHARQGRHALAEELLSGALAFYSGAGDELSICAICCHLAWLHLQQRQPETAETYLAPAQAWLQARNARYFPHWWSPTIMADLCLDAVENLPAAQCVVHNMCVVYLAANARTPLAGLMQAGDPPVRVHAGIVAYMRQSVEAEKREPTPRFI